jgi:RNA polymerase sigma-70 factor (ECF subfamily)
VAKVDVPADQDGSLEEYWPVVYRYVYRRLWRDREAALDVTQDTFASALGSSPKSGQPVVSSEAWLISIARRRVADHLRRESKRVEASQPFMIMPGEETELRLELLRALDELDPGHAEALVLRYVCDLPVKRIAAMLELTPKALESRLSRARRALHSRLTEVGLNE